MTKKEIRSNCDYWMLNALNGAIEAEEYGWSRTQRKEHIARAEQVLLLASSLEIINEKEFDNINKAIHFTTLNN